MKKLSCVLTVTPNPAIDKTVFVDQMKIGQSVREEKMAVCTGGKAINVSRGLKAFGLGTCATGFLGGFNGAFIDHQLSAEGVDHTFTMLKDQTRTSLTIIDRRCQATRILERGPRVTMKASRDFKARFESLLTRSDMVVASGSLPPGVSDYFYQRLVRQARHYGVPVIIDAAGPSLTLACRMRPYLVTPNIHEAAEIVGYRLRSHRRIKDALVHIHILGAQHVIISMDKEGAMGYDGKGFYYVPTVSVKQKNYVGCGDALVAGFIYGLSKGCDFSDALCYGVATGAANLLTLFPGRIDQKHVRLFMKKIKAKKV